MINCHGYQLVMAMCASPLQEIVDPAKQVDNKSNTSSTLKQKEPVDPQDTRHVYTDQEAEHLQVMKEENGESKSIVDPSKLLPERVSSVYPIPFIVAGSQSSQTNYDSEINLHMRYEFEAERLKSFVGWPLNELVHPEQLARVGFVYTGEGSLVQCFQCGVRYRNWLKGDIPLSVHQGCNPDCLFLRTLSCKSKSSSLERPQELTVNNQSENFSLGFPDYTDQATRLQSFKYCGGVLPKEELTETGFYMIARRDLYNRVPSSTKGSDKDDDDSQPILGILYPPSWSSNPPPLSPPPGGCVSGEQNGSSHKKLDYNTLTSLNSLETTCKAEDTVYNESLSVTETVEMMDTRVNTTEGNSHLSGALRVSSRNHDSRHACLLKRCHFSTDHPPPGGWDGSAPQGCIIPPDFSAPSSADPYACYPYPISCYQERPITEIMTLRHYHADMCKLTEDLDNYNIEPVSVSDNVGEEHFVLGQCHICKDNIVKFSFIPCGHTMCSTCSRMIMDSTRQCPYCRCLVTTIHRIYL
ncbi:uncharacterized protein [Dysidea avara]|uniref:uncharacterized protein isoform X2 n=1 Tax=Dysidea avara TaxID=196820 RepID=UPI00331A3A9B